MTMTETPEDISFVQEPLSPEEQMRQERIKKAAQDALKEAEERRKHAKPLDLPPERGGYEDKPEPTRYQDWERKGITSDF